MPIMTVTPFLLGLLQLAGESHNPTLNLLEVLYFKKKYKVVFYCIYKFEADSNELSTRITQTVIRCLL